MSFHSSHCLFYADTFICFSITGFSTYKRRVLLANYKIRLSMDGLQLPSPPISITAQLGLVLSSASV